MNKPLLIKRLIFALALLLALQSLGASRAIAQPALPSSFYGTVKFNGENVPNDTLVIATVNGKPFTFNTYLDGEDQVYQIDIPGDDPDTAELDGGTEGSLITFTIFYGYFYTVPGPVYWHSGTNVEFDLEITGNIAPFVENMTVIVIPGESKTFELEASDPDGDIPTFEIDITDLDPLLGTMTDATPPVLTYEPSLDFYGSDSFTFKACDRMVCSDSATVKLRTNVAPVVIDASLDSFDEDTTLPINLGDYASDADEEDALTYEITVNPNHGVLSGTAPNLIYTPNANYYGSDSFTFKACDPFGACGEATINLTIDPVNDPPNANPITFTVFINTIDNELNLFYFEYPCPTPEDPSQTCKTYHVSDWEGHYVTWEIDDQPEHGELLPKTGSIYKWLYTPDIDFSGIDTFTYHVKETETLEKYNSNTATVTINVLERPQSDYAIFLPLILK